MIQECPNCGERDHPPEAVYCLTCGAPLDDRPATPVDPDAATLVMESEPSPPPLPVEQEPGRSRFVLRPIGVVGALAVGLSGALAWVDVGARDTSGWDLPLQVLAGHRGTAEWLNIGLALAVVGAAALLFVFLDLPYSPFRWMGLAAVGLIAWFGDSIGLYTRHADEAIDFIGVGAYTALAGAVLLAVPQWAPQRSGRLEREARWIGVLAILIPLGLLGAAAGWVYASDDGVRRAAPATTVAAATSTRPPTTPASSLVESPPSSSPSRETVVTTTSTAAPSEPGDELLLTGAEIDAIDSCAALAAAAVQHLTATAVKLANVLSVDGGGELPASAADLEGALGEGLVTQGDLLVAKGEGIGCTDEELDSLVASGIEETVLGSEEANLLLDLLGPPPPPLVEPDQDVSDG